MFVTNTVLDIFILIAIIVSGVILLGLVAWLILKLTKNLSFARSEPFKEKDASIDPRSESKRLSKISRDNFEPVEQRVKPIILEAGMDGEVKIKNPSALSKSEYKNDLNGWKDKNEKNVVFVHLAHHHDLQSTCHQRLVQQTPRIRTKHNVRRKGRSHREKVSL